MTPKTKLQIEVMSLKKSSLRPLTQHQKDWAKEKCLTHKGFTTKNRVIFMDCGESFSSEQVKNGAAICPHCSTRISIEKSPKRSMQQRECFAVAEIVKDFQVVRHFEVSSTHKAKNQAQYSYREILQHWIKDDGKREVVSGTRNYVFGGYNWGGDLEIRNKRDTGKYDVYPYAYYPGSKFRDIWEKYGINNSLKGLTFLEACTILPENSKAETLLKAKRYEFLFKMPDRTNQIARFWPSIKIALRNKYTIKDAGIWLDYLELLSFYGKDLRNAFYVCPKNLKKQHDRYVDKKREHDRKMEIERRKEMISKAQDQYEKHIRRFKEVQIQEDDIVIKPLVHVKEFLEEGDTLKHCLFANHYYNKPDSLILSARIDNKPIETIEISLSKARILQARGERNGYSPHHDRIVELVTNNLPQIAKLYRRKNKAS